uniref:CSON005464 protein n=1 Tax=Culicoides sonorensis TaxID=179676 RepID=A0A336LUU4_CULSO
MFRLRDILVFLVLIFLENVIKADQNHSQTILIELPDKLSLNEITYFQIFELESSTEHKIILKNLQNTKDVFGLLQIHSFLYPIAVEDLQGTIIDGTNIGFTVQKDGEFTLKNNNNYVNVEAAITFIAMNKSTAPIPGGCNKVVSEFSVPIIKISGINDENSDIIKVSTPLASSARSQNCTGSDVTYEHRYKYLRIGDMSSSTYFDGIKDMITAEQARQNGRKTHLSYNTENETISLFAKIKGTGIVFQTIALDYGGRSVYIPGVTYSCNVSAWKSNCTRRDLLSVGFYVVILIISILLMTRMFLPRTVNHLAVGMGTGLVLGTYITTFISMDIDWKAFIAIFTSLSCTGINYVICQRYSKISHYITSFWLCYFSSLSLFFVTSASFNLVDYQYIFLVSFIILGTIFLGILETVEIKTSILAGGFIFLFSISFMINGHLKNIIEQPFYLVKDFKYFYATKDLLIAPQDMISLLIAIACVVFLFISYNRYGNVWEKLLERERLMRARRVALGGGTLEERLQVASEQTPLITRYTETEEDEVFESPNTNKEFYKRIKRNH